MNHELWPADEWGRPVPGTVGDGVGGAGVLPVGADVAGDPVRRGWAGLLRVFEPSSGDVVDYVSRVGPVAAWRAIKERRAPRAVLSPTAARTENLTPAQLEELVDVDLAAAAGVGARIIGPGDAEWPEAALVAFSMATARGTKYSVAPVALYVRGRPLADLPFGALSIVGSRANTAYGQRVAADIAMGAADAGFTVISGAAFGIDTVAHRSALAYPGELPTIAVLACGIDRAYPVANTALLDRIAQVGSVISEYPPGFSPARHRFLVRNRLIAALSAGTVVVEAGRRSGTLSTAMAALMLGRVLMAVPGPVTSALSVGCHLLLSDSSAVLVTGAQDVLAAVGRRGSVRLNAGVGQPGGDPMPAGGVVPAARVDGGERYPTDGLDPEVARVYEALPSRGARTVGQLSVESGLPASEVMAGLAVLELHDLVRRHEGLWRRRRNSEDR
ncbi:DNA processing protein [Nakamurella sp. UYEF19]|uniref:DNA-processing protein DprA n=1 Tax=Nakamurella sp. UYEF19 TaxID=1756392 RepID=UPI003398CD43